MRRETFELSARDEDRTRWPASGAGFSGKDSRPLCSDLAFLKRLNASYTKTINRKIKNRDRLLFARYCVNSRDVLIGLPLRASTEYTLIVRGLRAQEADQAAIHVPLEFLLIPLPPIPSLITLSISM